MNDDIRRSWAAANRFDAPRHPFPWRAVYVPANQKGDDPLVPFWNIVDAAGRSVAECGTRGLAECIAALPELMGEYEPIPRQGVGEPKRRSSSGYPTKLRD